MPAALLGGPLLYGRNTDAICNELPPLARHGQNERGLSIGKKNSLFCGNEGGGETWAILASLLSTAKLHGVDPETYLTDVLERMVSGATKNNRLDELLVWNWKAAREAEKVAA